jgi:hypothetical protein
MYASVGTNALILNFGTRKMYGKSHVPTALTRGKGSPARSRAGVDVFEEKYIRVRGGNLNPDGLF